MKGGSIFLVFLLNSLHLAASTILFTRSYFENGHGV